MKIKILHVFVRFEILCDRWSKIVSTNKHRILLRSFVIYPNVIPLAKLTTQHNSSFVHPYSCTQLAAVFIISSDVSFHLLSQLHFISISISTLQSLDFLSFFPSSAKLWIYLFNVTLKIFTGALTRIFYSKWKTNIVRWLLFLREWRMSPKWRNQCISFSYLRRRCLFNRFSFGKILLYFFIIIKLLNSFFSIVKCACWCGLNTEHSAALKWFWIWVWLSTVGLQDC